MELLGGCMNKIEMYKAEDGKLFYEESECFHYEWYEMKIDPKTNKPAKYYPATITQEYAGEVTLSTIQENVKILEDELKEYQAEDILKGFK